MWVWFVLRATFPRSLNEFLYVSYFESCDIFMKPDVRQFCNASITVCKFNLKFTLRFIVGKAAVGHGADYSLPSSGTSTPPYVFMAWYLLNTGITFRSLLENVFGLRHEYHSRESCYK